jgi:hypothetical protein
MLKTLLPSILILIVIHCILYPLLVRNPQIPIFLHFSQILKLHYIDCCHLFTQFHPKLRFGI